MGEPKPEGQMALQSARGDPLAGLSTLLGAERRNCQGWALREGNSRRGGSGERASGRSAEETSSEKHLYSLLNYLADREAIRNVLLLHGLGLYLFT